MNPIQNEKKQILKHFFSPYENVYKKIKKRTIRSTRNFKSTLAWVYRKTRTTAPTAGFTEVLSVTFCLFYVQAVYYICLHQSDRPSIKLFVVTMQDLYYHFIMSFCLVIGFMFVANFLRARMSSKYKEYMWITYIIIRKYNYNVDYGRPALKDSLAWNQIMRRS